MNRPSAEEIRRRIYHGLIPAVPIPFGAEGHIDVQAQRGYVGYLREQPIAGVAVWAHTGRGLHLSREQRMQVLTSWRNALGPERVLVAGVGGSPSCAADVSLFMDSALAMAHDALEGGANALLVYPPSPLRGHPESDDLTLDYHRQLALTGAPLILFYLYEAAGGISYSRKLLRCLLALPGVIGIKLATLDSVMTFQSVANLLAAEFPDRLIITGEDRFLGYSLMCGARAALVAMGAACTKLQYELVRSYFDGRGDDFLRLSERVDRLSHVLFIRPMEGYIRRMLWALVHLGVFARKSAHDPWGPELPETEFERIGETLRALGEPHA